MLSGSFPIIALSNHTIFSQTQTDATVPLRTGEIGLGWFTKAFSLTLRNLLSNRSKIFKLAGFQNL